MLVLTPENNIAGFLTAVYRYYYEFRDSDARVFSGTENVSFFDETVAVPTERVKAEKVAEGIIKKGGRSFFEDITDAYLSGNAGKENIIFRYLKLFFKYGRKVKEMFGDADVSAFNEILNKVRHETARLCGFIRLQETGDGLYYGYFTSDNDIIELIMPFFAARYNIQRIVLHDIARNKMMYYDLADYYYIEPPENGSILLTDTEVLFQSLWKQYFKNVSIAERKNERQQNQFMPKRYRHFMLEITDQT